MDYEPYGLPDWDDRPWRKGLFFSVDTTGYMRAWSLIYRPGVGG